ncbi:MAG: prepilin peptidase, partial [Anaerolineae bacterium]
TIGFIFFLLTAIIDFKYRLVLNIMVYPAILIVTAARLLAGAEIMPLLFGGGLAFGVFYLTSRLSELGGGDIKLALLMGVLFGFPQILWALILATGIGALIAVGLWLWQHNAKFTMPYAPFMCFGAILALLYNPLPTL